MASKEWRKLEAEREQCARNWDEAISATKRHLETEEKQAREDDANYADDLSELACPLCFQDGRYEVIVGDESRWEWCECEHGKEAKDEAENVYLNAAAERLEVQP